MRLQHELIEYTNQAIPVKWIVHSGLNLLGTVLPHWHASIEITYMVAGEVDDFTINNIAYPCVAGNIFVVNSAEVHSSRAKYCPELEALTIQFPYEFLNQMLPDFERKRFVNFKLPGTAETIDLKSVLDEFYRLVTAEQAGLFEVQINRMIYEILFYLGKFWMYEADKAINYNVYARKLGKVQPVISYIQENYQEELSVESIADFFYMSPNYLNKLFQKNLGISILKYIQLVRVNQAQRLLLFTDKPTHIISETVGFPNEKSFRKAFKEVFQMTPKKYQSDNKKI